MASHPTARETREDLNNFVAHIREMAGTGAEYQRLPQDARDFLRVQSQKLEGGVKKLTKHIERLPYEHAQEHAFGELWKVLAAAFIIGSRATVSDNTEVCVNFERVRKAHAGRKSKSKSALFDSALIDVYEQLLLRFSVAGSAKTRHGAKK